MSSLVERLRDRSDRKPIYQLDESDDHADFVRGKLGTTEEKFERIVRTDAKEDSCQACGESENLMSCDTCTYAYHAKCLLPPLKAPPPGSWRCLECVSPLNDVDKILDCEMRPTVAGDSDVSKLGSKQIFVKQYLVKWKGFSYLHCTWVPEKEFLKAFKSNPRLRTKVNNFHRQMSSNNNAEEDFVAIRPEWTTVDRILACRGEDDEKEYLVKYKELFYDECYWEYESDISAFQPEIERFCKIQSRSHRLSSNKQKSSPQDVSESTKKAKEFQQYEHSPEFLSGGSLHPYQLEGLNFLCFSWSKQTHVILADEMGLGKTIQSIAFLASLFEVSIFPHLVVAPLSTLRNWEREFATWAPQMNVVMYVGTSQARNVIREYEFYFPKNHKKIKKKKSGQVVSESKQDRIKFDVLLTSYEMINLDSASLKPIKWECMIVDEGHCLKNKDSKLFSSLKQYSSRHRVLLTGTPLQNNLDELFMLMHFLDAGKFGSLEEFQEEFKDFNQEEQISRLHKMLAPHLLRSMFGRKLNSTQALEVLCRSQAGAGASSSRTADKTQPQGQNIPSPPPAPRTVDATPSQTPIGQATPSSPQTARPTKRRLHRVGEEDTEAAAEPVLRKKHKATKGKSAAASSKTDLRSLMIEDFPEDVREGIAHLLPTINHMTRHVDINRGLAYETISPAETVEMIGRLQAKLHYLLATNMDVLSTIIAEGGQAQRLQNRLTSAEKKHKTEVEKLKGELLERTRERDSARAEAVILSLEANKCKEEAAARRCAEDELARARTEQGNLQDKVGDLQGKLTDLQNELASKVEIAKVDARIEGLVESLEIIRQSFPGLDLSLLETVVKYAKGEITADEIGGPSTQRTDPEAASSPPATTEAPHDDNALDPPQA